MADSTSTPTSSRNTSAVAGSSRFQRTVSLYDWWLIKSENDFQGKRLAVAGITSKNTDSPFMKGAMRVFVSAPVIKRYDVFSLETADGIYVIIKGFINEKRTLENGFPPEVFNCFLFGFPSNWERYTVDCFRKELATGVDSSSAVPDNVLPIEPEILSDDVEKSIPTTGVDSRSAVPNNVPATEPEILSDEVGKSIPTSGVNSISAVPNNVPATEPEILSDDVEKSIPTASLASSEDASGDREKPFPENEFNASMEIGGVNVVNGSAGNRRSTRLHNIQICQQKNTPASGCPPKHTDKEQISICFREESATGVDSSSAVPDNVPAIEPEILSDDVEKSIPTVSLASSENASGDHEKPLPEDEFNASMETGGVNVVNGSVGNRRSTRLHNIKFCQQKNTPASGCPPKHTDKEQISICFREESATGVDSSSAVPDNIPAIEPEILSDGVEKSIPTTSLASPEDASGDHEKPFPEDEFNASMEMGEVNVVNGNAGNRRSTRLHNIKVCRQKNTPASGCPPKYTDKEKISTSAAFLDLENPDGEGLKSPVTPVQSQSLGQVNASSEQLVKKSASKISRALSPNTEGCYKKKRVAAKTKAISSTGCPPMHTDKEQISTSGAFLDLENPDGQGLKSPVTPVQSQSLGQVNASSEQLLKKSASRISRALSPNTEGCYKKKRVTAKTEAFRPKRKINKSASAVKYPRERDESPLIKGGKQKLSSVSPKSLGLRKSRSGRLLLPPLEFWRNQIPVYNADREISEIQDGASLVSPFKGSFPSLNRKSKNQKPTARGATVS